LTPIPSPSPPPPPTEEERTSRVCCSALCSIGWFSDCYAASTSARRSTVYSFIKDYTARLRIGGEVADRRRGHSGAVGRRGHGAS
jgi:hypothetical protein